MTKVCALVSEISQAEGRKAFRTDFISDQNGMARNISRNIHPGEGGRQKGRNPE